MYEISIFLPTIRTHLLEGWYQSLEQSIGDIPFEVVFAGPFEIPESLSKRENVKWLKTYQSPNIAAKRAAMACSGKYLLHHIDDGLFQPNVLKEVHQYVCGLENEWIVGLPYTEGRNYNGGVLPDYYWRVKGSFNWPRLNAEWGMNCHWVMPREQFLRYGGFYSQFNYLVGSCNDLLWRQQANGAVFYDFGKVVTLADWEEGETGSHAPIHHNHHRDLELLYSLWSQETRRETVVGLEDWYGIPEVWNARFGNDKPSSYEELYPNS